MTNLKNTTATITGIKDLSPTAREYTITPHEPFPFVAGAFVNLFITDKNEAIRRAFSFASDDQKDSEFSVAIRLSPQGKFTPLLWEEDFLGREVKIMGPLGRNTADRMNARKVFLFGFGIGAGVVKALAEHLIRRTDLETLIIVTGNRHADEILYKDFFNALTQNDTRVQVRYVVSDRAQTAYPTGFIQDHIDDYDFTATDVYMCGQEVACSALKEVIEKKSPQDCHFMVEAFH